MMLWWLMNILLLMKRAHDAVLANEDVMAHEDEIAHDAVVANEDVMAHEDEIAHDAVLANVDVMAHEDEMAHVMMLCWIMKILLFMKMKWLMS